MNILPSMVPGGNGRENGNLLKIWFFCAKHPSFSTASLAEFKDLAYYSAPAARAEEE